MAEKFPSASDLWTKEIALSKLKEFLPSERNVTPTLDVYIMKTIEESDDRITTDKLVRETPIDVRGLLKVVYNCSATNAINSRCRTLASEGKLRSYGPSGPYELSAPYEDK